jgi:hypothetical protein
MSKVKYGMYRRKPSEKRYHVRPISAAGEAASKAAGNSADSHGGGGDGVKPSTLLVATDTPGHHAAIAAAASPAIATWSRAVADEGLRATPTAAATHEQAP